MNGRITSSIATTVHIHFEQLAIFYPFIRTPLETDARWQTIQTEGQ